MNNTIMEKPLEVFIRILAILFCGVFEILTAPFKATGKICLILSEEVLTPILKSLTEVIRRLEEKAVTRRVEGVV